MKPYEGDWINDETRPAFIVEAQSGADIAVFENHHGRAQLAAAAPDMARLLMEFAFLDADLDVCPWCAEERGRHAADCPLAAALQKAGVLQLDDEGRPTLAAPAEKVGPL